MTTLAASMSEKELSVAVIDLAHILGWHVAHFRPAQTRRGNWVTPMTGDVGFPDLVLARYGAVVFAELKSERGKVAPAQEAWIEALTGGDNGVFVWRPHDWLAGTIESVLR